MPKHQPVQDRKNCYKSTTNLKAMLADYRPVTSTQGINTMGAGGLADVYSRRGST